MKSTGYSFQDAECFKIGLDFTAAFPKNLPNLATMTGNHFNAQVTERRYFTVDARFFRFFNVRASVRTRK